MNSPVSHGYTKINSKGSCIYCGEQGVRLTDEHIVPLSLGGQHIIREASCDNCAKITTRFEQDVARELWGDARISFNAPSRRKKQRKTHIFLTDPNNPMRKVKVPYADYPAPIILYKMSRAGLLEGLPEEMDISAAWSLEALADHETNVAFERKYGIPVVGKFRHVPASFARLIAKIGYGQILSSLDPGDFHPICLPYILGSRPNISYVVGSGTITGAPEANIGYSLGTRLFGTRDRMMLMATVRLYANNSTPTYHVVVGEVVGKQEVARALSKLGSGEVQLLRSCAHNTGNPGEERHWSPNCWPLPFWSTR